MFLVYQFFSHAAHIPCCTDECIMTGCAAVPLIFFTQLHYVKLHSCVMRMFVFISFSPFTKQAML